MGESFAAGEPEIRERPKKFSVGISGSSSTLLQGSGRPRNIRPTLPSDPLLFPAQPLKRTAIELHFSVVHARSGQCAAVFVFNVRPAPPTDYGLWSSSANTLTFDFLRTRANASLYAMSGDDVLSESAKRRSNTTSADAMREERKTTPPAPSIGEKPELDDFGLPIRPKRTPAVTLDTGNESAESEGGKVQEVGVETAEKHDSVRADTKDKPSEGPASKTNPTQEVEETAVAAQRDGEDSSTARRSGDHPSVDPTTATSTSTPQSPSNARKSLTAASPEKHHGTASEWSHQVIAPQADKEDDVEEEDKWETMPAYAPFDIYDDNNKLIAREQDDSGDEVLQYGTLGGAGKGYTRVGLDDDVQSVTSMDDNTAYLFKETGTNVADEDDDLRDASSQMQATKQLLTEGQRIAYVGIVKLAMIEMIKEADGLEHTKGAKKFIELTVETLKMWSQKMMVRLYGHMEVESAGQ
jgi:hypothetical protein